MRSADILKQDGRQGLNSIYILMDHLASRRPFLLGYEEGGSAGRRDLTGAGQEPE